MVSVSFVLKIKEGTMQLYRWTSYFLSIPGGNRAAGVTGETHERHVTRHSAPSCCSTQTSPSFLLRIWQQQGSTSTRYAVTYSHAVQLLDVWESKTVCGANAR